MPWPAGRAHPRLHRPERDGETLVRAGSGWPQRCMPSGSSCTSRRRDCTACRQAERNQRIAWLRLAETLGAETVTLGGPSAAAELVHYAQARNVTRVLMGRAEPQRLCALAAPSTVDQVLAHIRGIDVTVVKTTEAMRIAKSPLLARSAAFLDAPPSAKKRWPQYVWAAVGVAAATALAWVTTSVLNEPNIVMMFLLSSRWSRWRFGRGPVGVRVDRQHRGVRLLLRAAAVHVQHRDGQYLLTFAVMTAVGLLIGTLMNSVRLQARVAGHRERRTALLYAMSRELAAVRGVDGMARVAVRHIGEAFESQAVVLLPDERRRTAVAPFAAGSGVVSWCRLCRSRNGCSSTRSPRVSAPNTLPGTPGVICR